MDQWLDAGHGSCLLGDPENAGIIRDSVLHFEGKRSVAVSFVIMPNHVHLLFAPHPDWRLNDLIFSWKSFSAIQINRRLGRSGVLWQKDYFDRLVRDEDHFANCVRYIRRNPGKARLREGEYLLWESDTAKQIE